MGGRNGAGYFLVTIFCWKSRLGLGSLWYMLTELGAVMGGGKKKKMDSDGICLS